MNYMKTYLYVLYYTHLVTFHEDDTLAFVDMQVDYFSPPCQTKYEDDAHVVVTTGRVQGEAAEDGDAVRERLHHPNLPARLQLGEINCQKAYNYIHY